MCGYSASSRKNLFKPGFKPRLERLERYCVCPCSKPSIRRSTQTNSPVSWSHECSPFRTVQKISTVLKHKHYSFSESNNRLQPNSFGPRIQTAIKWGGK